VPCQTPTACPTTGATRTPPPPPVTPGLTATPSGYVPAIFGGRAGC
jgi:hypothetical protein